MATNPRVLSMAPELAATGPVESKSMLQSSGLAAAGSVFAIHVGGAVVLKLPADTVADLVSSHRGQPFGMGGRVMREWVSLDGVDADAQVALAEQSRAFVASQPRKPKRAKSGAGAR
jgi:TfoX/Sxy family transcriptional regulator of competence genes